MPGVKDWLKKSSNDLKASIKLSDDDDTLDCAVFHTHQCAEKAFKAFVVLAQRPIPKTHSLRFLLIYCIQTDPELSVFRDESKHLDDYGHDARYPNDSFYVDKQDTQKAIGMAETILNFIQKKIHQTSN